MALLFALSLAAACLPSAFSQESHLPKTWKICRRSDPDLNGCLKIAISSAIKELKNGNSQLGVPAIDPMHFRAITVNQGSGAIGINLKFSNLNIHGLSRAVIDRVNVDYASYRYDIDARVEGKLLIAGDYVSSGKVLVIPIKGGGKCNMTFDNFSAKVSMRGREVNRDGQKFLQFFKTDIVIDTTRLYVSFRRPGQEGISKILNHFMNDNWKQILNDMKPAISQSFGANIQEVTNDIFNKIPLSQIAPP